MANPPWNSAATWIRGRGQKYGKRGIELICLKVLDLPHGSGLFVLRREPFPDDVHGSQLRISFLTHHATEFQRLALLTLEAVPLLRVNSGNDLGLGTPAIDAQSSDGGLGCRSLENLCRHRHWQLRGHVPPSQHRASDELDGLLQRRRRVGAVCSPEPLPKSTCFWVSVGLLGETSPKFELQEGWENDKRHLYWRPFCRVYAPCLLQRAQPQIHVIHTGDVGSSRVGPRQP
mmetsp:Transcript_119245/g.283033  ORF Transcript_119245/g.283033 Transcript_119245/m.283033 type:complete len:231 (-) Transcript_119245:1311-2003(-)